MRFLVILVAWAVKKPTHAAFFLAAQRPLPKVEKHLLRFGFGLCLRLRNFGMILEVFLLRQTNNFALGS
jgi:hypothetical protein